MESPYDTTIVRAERRRRRTAIDDWEQLRDAARSGDDHAADDLVTSSAPRLKTLAAIAARLNYDDPTSEALARWWECSITRDDNEYRSVGRAMASLRDAHRFIRNPTPMGEQFVDQPSTEVTESPALSNVGVEELLDAVPDRLRGVARRIAEGSSLASALKAEDCHRMTWNRYVTAKRAQRTEAIGVA